MSNKIYYQKSSSGRTKKNDWRSRIWNSNLFSVFLIVLLILSFVKVSKEILLRYEIHQEIKHLEGQLSELEGKSAEMEKLIAYLETDEYIEAEARLKLNLGKPGEKQINLPLDSDTLSAESQTDDSANALKWFEYFFR